MTAVTRDFRLILDDAPLAAVLPGSRERPGLRRRAERALAELAAVAEPSACYASHPIEAVLHDRLRRAGGARIGCGTLASIVAGADELYVAVCALGRALDERIREHRVRGSHFDMLVLDELGSWAVDQLRTQLYERIGKDLAERGRHTSSPLSPGEAAWALREQRIILGLVDAARIDVTLGVGDLMRPLKSLSFVFGAGAGALGAEGLTRCELCTIRDRCRYAVARLAHPARSAPVARPSAGSDRLETILTHSGAAVTVDTLKCRQLRRASPSARPGSPAVTSST